MDDDYYDERDITLEEFEDDGCDDDREPADPYWYESDFDNDTIDGVGFADPGGRSALRAATKSNPRNLPCPDCGRENVLTPADVRAGYFCADAKEGPGF